MTLIALAIFGDGTFFDTSISVGEDMASTGTSVCNHLLRPFSDLFNMAVSDPPDVDCAYYRNGTLMFYLVDWLDSLMDPMSLQLALRGTLLTVSKATLQPAWHEGIRTIVASHGTDVLKPSMSLVAMVIISFLIMLQLCGLLMMVIYASTRPTWTTSLDSFALLRIGATMADELPLISPLAANKLALLDEKKGWVGRQKDDEELKTLALGGSRPLLINERYRSAKQGKTLTIYKSRRAEEKIKVNQD